MNSNKIQTLPDLVSGTKCVLKNKVRNLLVLRLSKDFKKKKIQAPPVKHYLLRPECPLYSLCLARI